MEAKTKAENEFVLFEMREGVLFATFKKGIVIDIEAAKEILKLRLSFTLGKPHSMLIIDGGVKDLKREARVYFNSEEGQKNVLASVFIVKNTFTKIMVSFFTKLTNNRFPIKTYTNEEEAFAWLKTFVEK